MARGWVDADGRVLNQGQGDPLRAVQALATLPEKTVAVFFDLHPYLAQLPELVRAVRDAFPAAKATQRPLLFCSPEPTWPVEWEKDVAPLDYPLPSREALRGVLDELLAPAKVTLPPAVRDAMLEAARGLTWNEAENAFALALMRDRARIAAMPATVQAEKTALVRKSGLLDLLTPAETLDGVGGLAPLKAWIAGQGALLARAAEALAWGFAARDLPKGVLLLGVPGTGKSLLARAIAGSWGLPLLRLEMARILGSLVGQSEARTQSALRLAEAMAPCVLHVDEIEKTLAGAGAGHLDSGVSSRVVGEPAHLAPGARTRPGRDPRAGVRRGDGEPDRGAPAGAVPPRPVRPGVLPRPPRADGARRRPRDSPPRPAAVRAARRDRGARRAHGRVQRGRARAGRQGGVPARVPGRRPPPASRGPRGRARERHAAGGEPRRGDRRDPWMGADTRPARQRPRRARRTATPGGAGSTSSESPHCTREGTAPMSDPLATGILLKLDVTTWTGSAALSAPDLDSTRAPWPRTTPSAASGWCRRPPWTRSPRSSARPATALEGLSHALPDGSRFVLAAATPEVEVQLTRTRARFGDAVETFLGAYPRWRADMAPQWDARLAPPGTRRDAQGRSPPSSRRSSPESRPHTPWPTRSGGASTSSGGPTRSGSRARSGWNSSASPTPSGPAARRTPPTARRSRRASRRRWSRASRASGPSSRTACQAVLAHLQSGRPLRESAVARLRRTIQRFRALNLVEDDAVESQLATFEQTCLDGLDPAAVQHAPDLRATLTAGLQAVVEAATAEWPQSALTGRALRRFDVETEGEPGVPAAAGANPESPVAA